VLPDYDQKGKPSRRQLPCFTGRPSLRVYKKEKIGRELSYLIRDEQRKLIFKEEWGALMSSRKSPIC